MQEKVLDKIDLMKECIEKTKYRTDAVNLFSEKTNTHKATAYDYYLLATTGKPSKRILNASLRKERTKALNDRCYFCDGKSEEGHHYDYLKDRQVSLCQSCHKKVHFIFESYHNAIIDKDRILMQIKQLIFSR